MMLKASVNLLCKRERFLAGGSDIVVLYGRVEKVERLANRSTSVVDGTIITKSNLLAKNPDLLVNGSTCWPPYNWQVVITELC